MNQVTFFAAITDTMPGIITELLNRTGGDPTSATTGPAPTPGPRYQQQHRVRIDVSPYAAENRRRSWRSPGERVRVGRVRAKSSRVSAGSGRSQTRCTPNCSRETPDSTSPSGRPCLPPDAPHFRKRREVLTECSVEGLLRFPARVRRGRAPTHGDGKSRITQQAGHAAGTADQRREQMLRAALEVIAKRGYPETRITDVAALHRGRGRRDRPGRRQRRILLPSRPVILLIQNGAISRMRNRPFRRPANRATK